ncbi:MULTISPECIES: DUF962 domain-containing protein [unclassified Nocardia]|uniref:DUF962 domain-containing protein n=1 Tax=unclassified Nocardia TaxID=2637762 RepID=UPI001CE4A5E3|nr:MULTISPECIES: DUF962 domain-containing protein [unclassified Nocardia]
MSTPSPAAPFSEKLAYYQSIHTSSGVKATHLVGLPMVVASLPLLFARPRVGSLLFVAGWSLNIGGHLLFEKQNPALRHGPITYQLAGVVTWATEVGEFLARRSARRAAKQSAFEAAAH